MKLRSAAAVLLLAALAFGLMWFAPFYRTCGEISACAVRLHIVANSDSEADQQVKLLVRDAVLDTTREQMRRVAGTEEAMAVLSGSLNDIEAAADRVLAEAGFPYTARARLCQMHFDTLRYGDATLPSGAYTALRVELGEADGRNWWCVMYPPLCVMAAGEEQQPLLAETFTEEQTEIILGGERYAVRFKLLEWFEKLFG